MISRIQEIKNIGTFLSSRPASIELSKLVLMYGPNSQGKTTICDVIKSLKNNDPIYITQRKTVVQRYGMSHLILLDWISRIHLRECTEKNL